MLLSSLGSFIVVGSGSLRVAFGQTQRSREQGQEIGAQRYNLVEPPRPYACEANAFYGLAEGWVARVAKLTCQLSPDSRSIEYRHI